MNGSDVVSPKGGDFATLRQDIALIGRDVQHLAEKVTEQTKVLKGREPRIRKLEDHCVEATAWRTGHDKEHSGISEQLGELKGDVKDIKSDMSVMKESLSSLNGGNKKAAVKGAAVGGVTLAAIFEVAREIIGLLK